MSTSWRPSLTSKGKTYLAGFLMIVASACLYYAGFQCFEDGTATRWTLGHFAAVFLSMGLMTLAYQVSIRQELIEEVWDLIKLQRDLANSGVQGVVGTPKFTWEANLQPARSYEIVVGREPGWVNLVWPYIIQTGKQRQCSIIVYMWEGDDEPSRHHADRLSERLFADWNKRRALGELTQGCSIDFKLLDDRPAFGVFLTKERAILSLPAIAHHVDGDGVTMVLDAESAILKDIKDRMKSWEANYPSGPAGRVSADSTEEKKEQDSV